MDTICTTILPTLGVGVLLFISEMLPFVGSVKSNGVTELAINVLLNYLEYKKRVLDIETGDNRINEGERNRGHFTEEENINENEQLIQKK